MRTVAHPLPNQRPVAASRLDRRPVGPAGTLREQTRPGSAATGTRWNPERHVPWWRFERERYSADHLAAAAVTWTRRADRLRPSITPSAVAREAWAADAKAPWVLKTTRDTAEAREAACCLRFANLLAGMATTAETPAAMQETSRAHAGWIAVATLLDTVDLARDRAARHRATDPVVRELLRRLISDRSRRARLQWQTLHAVSWTCAGVERDAIADTVLQDLIGGCGLASRLSWLAPAGNEWLEAEAITRLVGLGGLLPDEEAGIVADALGTARARLAAMGIHLPDLTTAIGA